MRSKCLPGFALTAALSAGYGGTVLAQVAPPSAEQARALEQQVRDALRGFSIGTLQPSARPVEFVPEGDHYLVRVPFGVPGEIDPPDTAFTTRARMLDATRWSLEDGRMTPRFTITTTIAVPDAAGAGKPSPGPTHPAKQVIEIKLGRQDSHGLFDPTFATPTTNEQSISGLDMMITGGIAPSLTHLDRLVGLTTIHPVSPDRVDLANDATIEGYASESQPSNGAAFKMTAQSVHLVSALTGLAHAKLLPFINAVAATARVKSDDLTGVKGDADVQANLRNTLISAKSLLTGGRIEETARDLRFDTGGHAGSVAKLAFAFGGDVPQDMLTATMEFTMDGLVLDELPPAMAAYIPTHASIRPTVSNISVADLTKMGMDATAPGGQVPPTDFQALYSHGGINLGFDSLGLDVAGAQFTGAGKFTMTGPQTLTGEAEIQARGLDALITRAQADPMLAPGIPAVIFLKGIAHTSGDQAVWQISVANKKILVNGVDLSALTGAMP